MDERLHRSYRIEPKSTAYLFILLVRVRYAGLVVIALVLLIVLVSFFGSH